MSDEFRPGGDELVSRNAEFAAGFDEGGLQVAPTRRLAVVACMDSRMDVFRILGLANGEAHIIRNAGGVVTDDVIRSVCISQRLLGTREIVLVHHTDCGLEKVDEITFRAELAAEVGREPPWAIEAFTDPFSDVRLSIHRLRRDPFVRHADHVRGFVYDVATGLIHEVEAGDSLTGR